MRFSLALFLVLLLAAVGPVQAQRGTTSQLEVAVKGFIEIDAEGRVHAHSYDQPLLPSLQERLDRVIKAWRFEPIVVDGVAVPARTRLQLNLVSLTADVNAMRISHAWFGEPNRRHALTPPTYPPASAAVGLEGRVVLVLGLTSTGGVDRVHVEQTSLSHPVKTEAQARAWRGNFERAAIAAAKQWTFDITETVNGQPMMGAVRVPVVFSFSNGAGWQRYYPGPFSPAPWIDPTNDSAAGAQSLQSGRLQPLASRFRPTMPIAGQSL